MTPSLAVEQISIGYIPEYDSVAVRVALPIEACRRILAWVRETRMVRVGRFMPLNMFVEEDWDDASFFWLDECPCSVGQFYSSSCGQDDLFTGIQVQVDGEGPSLDWTVPHDKFGLDGRLQAAGLIRQLLKVAGVPTRTEMN
jgi:hypothetical protein